MPDNMGNAVRNAVRCGRCQLLQFETRSGDCRKCAAHLPIPKPEPPPPLSMPTRCGPLHNGRIRGKGSNYTPAVSYFMLEFRRFRRFRQEDLCQLLHAPRSYISKIERCKLVPGTDMIARIAAVINRDMIDLITPLDSLKTIITFTELPSHCQRRTLEMAKAMLDGHENAYKDWKSSVQK